MAREIVRFKSEERADRSRVTSFLRALADKIDAGQVTLAKGEETTEVHIPETVVLEVKLEDEETEPVKHSLEVEIEWREGDEGGGRVKLA